MHLKKKNQMLLWVLLTLIVWLEQEKNDDQEKNITNQIEHPNHKEHLNEKQQLAYNVVKFHFEANHCLHFTSSLQDKGGQVKAMLLMRYVLYC